MMYRNTKNGYGAIARWMHWLMALGIFGLFALGYWMRTLTYYSPYYKPAPEIHQGIGLIMLALMLFRLFWRITNPSPDHAELTRPERMGSALLHWGFYPLLIVMMIAGYFITTLDGRPIHFFGLFDVPSIYTQKGLEKLAGQIHWILAYGIIGLALLHTLAALWHHFVKRDGVMMSILKDPD